MQTQEGREGLGKKEESTVGLFMNEERRKRKREGGGAERDKLPPAGKKIYEWVTSLSSGSKCKQHS